MEPLSITAMKNANLATIDRDELVDIRDVKVNTSLPKRERAIDFIHRPTRRIVRRKEGLRMRHQAEYPAALVANTGNRIQ